MTNRQDDYKEMKRTQDSPIAVRRKEKEKELYKIMAKEQKKKKHRSI